MPKDCLNTLLFIRTYAESGWRWLIRLVSLTIILGSLYYLTKIPSGQIADNKRFNATEVGILAIALLFTSELFGNIVEITMGGGKLTVKVDNINKKAEANKEANQRQSQVIAILAAKVLLETDPCTRDKIFRSVPEKRIREYVFDYLIPDDQGRKILEYLSQRRHKKIRKNESNERYLRDLRALCFIKTIPENTRISAIPNNVDLRESFRITDWGYLCLALSSSDVVPPSDVKNIRDLRT
jgi:hypothetical protein